MTATALAAVTPLEVVLASENHQPVLVEIEILRREDRGLGSFRHVFSETLEVLSGIDVGELQV